MDIAAKKSLTPPHTVLVVSDNTVRECKNQFFLLYMTNLVAKHKLRVCALLNLRKAHSHSGIDQLWGILSRRISACDRLYSPQSIIEKIVDELHRPALRSWIGLSSEIHCQKLDSVRAWKGHFASTEQVGLSGGLLDDDTANHFFLMLLRRGSDSALGVLGISTFPKKFHSNSIRGNQGSLPPLCSPTKSKIVRFFPMFLY